MNAAVGYNNKQRNHGMVSWIIMINGTVRIDVALSAMAVAPTCGTLFCIQRRAEADETSG